MTHHFSIITNRHHHFRQASTGSFGSDSTFAGGEGEGGPPGVKITEIQAAWNVTNAIQGMFIVSLPFAVLRGGYWAILAMVGIAHICCYTGKVRFGCLSVCQSDKNVNILPRFSFNVCTSQIRRRANRCECATATWRSRKCALARKLALES
jgi:hypothetical protein